MPTWICVDSIILFPGVIDKEGADMVRVHSSQMITFRMMITTTHFFHGIKERVHVLLYSSSNIPETVDPSGEQDFSPT